MPGERLSFSMERLEMSSFRHRAKNVDGTEKGRTLSDTALS
jgi:hypothetical protein